MKSKLFLAMVAFSFLILPQALSQPDQHAPEENRLLTKEQWITDLDYVVKILKDLHPCICCRVSHDELMAAAENALTSIENSESDADCYFAIKKIIAILDDGHTNLSLKGKIDFTSMKLPLTVDYMADGFFVGAISEDNKELIGSKVLKINGEPIEGVVLKLLEITSVDNIIGRTERTSLYMRYPLVLRGVGIKCGEDEVKFMLETREGEIIEKVIKTNGTGNDNNLFTAQSLLGNSVPMHLKNRRENYWFEEIKAGKALYCQINVLENQGRGKDSFEKFTADFFRYYDMHAREIQKIIIDLRYNSGGNGRLSVPFIKEIIKRDSLNSRGKLYVVTGSKTYSAAIVMATRLLEYTEAVFVGSPGGCPASLFSNSLNAGNLPNSGYGLSVASRQIDNAWIPDREFFRIDIPVLMTGKDYYSGNDPVLNAILNNDALPIEDLAIASNADEAFSKYKEIVKKYPDIHWWNSSANLEYYINLKGYRFISSNQPDKAEQLLKLNSMIFPSSWNVWDSLGEIYFLNGKKDLSIKALEKSLELNPNNRNAIEGLKQLTK